MVRTAVEAAAVGRATAGGVDSERRDWVVAKAEAAVAAMKATVVVMEEVERGAK